MYRHARAREMARWKEMDAQEQEAELERQFQEELKACKTEEERKTARKRRKRQREKEAKERKKNLKKAGIQVDAATTNNLSTTKSTADGSAATSANDDEFTYVPLEQQKKIIAAEDASNEKRKSQNDISPTENNKLPTLDIPNDGSFLDMMKKQLGQGNGGDIKDESNKTRRRNGDAEGEDVSEEPPAKKRATTCQIFDIDEN